MDAVARTKEKADWMDGRAQGRLGRVEGSDGGDGGRELGVGRGFIAAPGAWAGREVELMGAPWVAQSLKLFKPQLTRAGRA